MQGAADYCQEGMFCRNIEVFHDLIWSDLGNRRIISGIWLIPVESVSSIMSTWDIQAKQYEVYNIQMEINVSCSLFLIAWCRLTTDNKVWYSAQNIPQNIPLEEEKKKQLPDSQGVALSGADRDRTDYLLNAIQSL